jgi:DNA-binding transcriptional ArsR family regulator
MPAVLTSRSGESLSRNLVFDLLSSPRRRMVLSFLRRDRDPCSVTELAEEIASLEYDRPVEDLSRQQRKRVYVSLYQTHVPKLADAGVIRYDEDASEVSLTRLAHRMDAYLTDPDRETYPWHYHYLALTAVGGLLLAAAAVVGLPAPLLVGLLVALGFAGSGLAQLLHRRRRQRELPPELTGDAAPVR